MFHHSGHTTTVPPGAHRKLSEMEHAMTLKHPRLHTAGDASWCTRPQRRWLALLLVGLFLTLPTTAYAKTVKPKDGAGIKWSQLKRCVREITLENGEKVQVPVTWRVYGRYTAYGYEVPLDKPVTVNGKKISKIKVWVFPKDPPQGITPEQWKQVKSWCHGLTFDDSIYNPGGEQVPIILAAGWQEVECIEPLKKGQIIVYSSNGTNPRFGPAGAVVHSAVANGNGTYTSKDRLYKQDNAQTKAKMDQQYGTAATSKCYKKK